MLRWFKTRLSSIVRPTLVEQELDSELQFHVEMLVEQNIAGGMAPAQAREAALRSFGPLSRVKEEVRETWLARAFETLTQDIRYGYRNIGRNGGYALIVVLTMGLGIGANTAIFSVVNGVLLKPLPYENGEQLVVLRQQQPLAGVEDLGFSHKEMLDYRTANSLEGLVEFHNMWFNVSRNASRPASSRATTSICSG
jgi:putative ABC transport system permease protein